MGVVVTLTDTMYRQLAETINSGNVIVFQIYHLVGVLYYGTD